MTDSMAGKPSADLRISKRFKYTPIFKNSFIKQKETPKRSVRDLCRDTGPGCVLGCIAMACVFVLSVAGSCILWGTNIVEDVMIENLILKNNSEAFNWWKKPTVHSVIRVYILNYTNTDNFMAGVEKLRVQELGPYSYREFLEKVNVAFNENGTITFQDKRSYEFLPELSVGSLSDIAVVPNMPFLSCVDSVKSQPYLVKLSLTALINTVNARPFVTNKVSDFLWGYQDRLFAVGRTVLSFKERIPFTKFGLLMGRQGVSINRVTIGNGEQDVSRLGVISRYNGHDRMNYWSSYECNRIDGVDGGVFPLHQVQSKSTLHVYSRELCRRFPLVFKEHSKIQDDIPTLRFHYPRDIFSYPPQNPSNACFCRNRACPPSGVFDASPCSYNTPVFLSLPHFLLGDPALQDTVDGLEPDPEKHDTYVDIHPKMGTAVAARSRIQINMMVHKVPGIPHLEPFTDGAILPIAWIEMALEDFPDDIRQLLYHITFSGRALQLVFMYGLPVLALVTACLLCRYARRHGQPKRGMITANISLAAA